MRSVLRHLMAVASAQLLIAFFALSALMGNGELLAVIFAIIFLVCTSLKLVSMLAATSFLGMKIIYENKWAF